MPRARTPQLSACRRLRAETLALPFASLARIRPPHPRITPFSRVGNLAPLETDIMDLAARAAMLQREVEAVARMDDYAPAEMKLSMLRNSGVPGVGWMNPTSSPSDPLLGAQRRNSPRQERRMAASPITPRSRHPAMLQRNSSRSVNLNDSSNSTPKDPTSPPFGEGDSASNASTASMTPLESPLDPVDAQGTKSSMGSSTNWNMDAAGIDLSKCISLLDDNDLAGLAAAEASYAMEKRAQKLARLVQEAASLPAKSDSNLEDSSKPPLAPLPLITSDSAFLGVELSLD
ncbi:MAG: hypothetical protein SGPRY_008610 [Prymnesium sp.]